MTDLDADVLIEAGHPSRPDRHELMRQHIARIKERTLRDAARYFTDEMAGAWGGDAQWFTTGNRVAEVVACVLRELADEVDA